MTMWLQTNKDQKLLRTIWDHIVSYCNERLISLMDYLAEV